MIKYESIIYGRESDQAFVLVSFPLRLSPTRGLTAIVEVPELSGCRLDSQTYLEAVTNAEVVISEWIETAQELWRNISTPGGGYFRFMRSLEDEIRADLDTLEGMLG